MMHLQAVDRALIVIVHRHMLCKGVQLQRLHLKVKLRAHYIVAVSLVPLWELDLIQFIFNHQLGLEEVIQWPHVCMEAREGTRLLQEVILSVKVIVELT
jgi:hypothetical protein